MKDDDKKLKKRIKKLTRHRFTSLEQLETILAKYNFKFIGIVRDEYGTLERLTYKKDYFLHIYDENNVVVFYIYKNYVTGNTRIKLCYTMEI